MSPVLKGAALIAAVLAVLAAAAIIYILNVGLSAREEPGWAEELVARTVRNAAIARDARELTNPVPVSDEAIAEGRAHFADHCATCHANDGSGNTQIGRNLFPRAPDMRQSETQKLSDGELFWIIDKGVRFTGMPAWGNDTLVGEVSTWQLVHFIRRLPTLTPQEIQEMESLNPRPPEAGGPESASPHDTTPGHH